MHIGGAGQSAQFFRKFLRNAQTVGLAWTTHLHVDWRGGSKV